MTARANPGAEFESAFRRSVPREVYVRRLPTPSAVGFRVPQLVDLAERLHGAVVKTVDRHVQAAESRNAGAGPTVYKIHAAALAQEFGVALAGLPDWLASFKVFRHTPKAGFDLQLTARAGIKPGPSLLAIRCKYEQLPAPVLVFDLELKSVAVDRLDFGNVDAAQEKALAAGAAAGHVAALVVEFRKAGEVWALPIQVWQEYRLTAQRSSMPLADARRLGMPILRDEERGVKLPYWRVGEFLRACGGEIS